jgi:hypothetical protein
VKIAAGILSVTATASCGNISRTKIPTAAALFTRNKIVFWQLTDWGIRVFSGRPNRRCPFRPKLWIFTIASAGIRNLTDILWRTNEDLAYVIDSGAIRSSPVQSVKKIIPAASI